MPTSENAAARPRGFVAGLRAVVRQLSVAVYVYLAFGICAALLRTSSHVWILEPILVLFASAVTGRLVDGPWWTSSFIGVFVALFDFGLRGVIVGSYRAAIQTILLQASISLFAGVLGGALGRHRRQRNESEGGLGASSAIKSEQIKSDL
jgi:hypothetical protein